MVIPSLRLGKWTVSPPWLVAGAVLGCVFLLFALFALCFMSFSKSKEDLLPLYANEASQFITLDNGAVAHIRDQGNPEGPVLVMLHGSGASLHTWEDWVGLLGNRFRLVSMDLPGHGLTGAVPDRDYSLEAMTGFVRDVALKLDLPRFSLAGNSMGGAIAAQYAADQPDDVAALILIDAAGFPDPDLEMKVPFMLRLLSKPGLSWILERLDPRSVVEKVLHMAFHDQALVTKPMITLYTDLILYDGNRLATLDRASDMPLDRLDIRPALGRIKAPVLILWGEEDRLVPVAQGVAFRDAIQDSRLITYPAVGHIPMEEAAEASSRDVRRFLETQASAEAVARSYGALPSAEGRGVSTVPARRGGKGAIEVAPLPVQ